MENPPPGTVVDHTVTKAKWWVSDYQPVKICWPTAVSWYIRCLITLSKTNNAIWRTSHWELKHWNLDHPFCMYLENTYLLKLMVISCTRLTPGYDEFRRDHRSVGSHIYHAWYLFVILSALICYFYPVGTISSWSLSMSHRVQWHLPIMWSYTTTLPCLVISSNS